MMSMDVNGSQSDILEHKISFLPPPISAMVIHYTPSRSGQHALRAVSSSFITLYSTYGCLYGLDSFLAGELAFQLSCGAIVSDAMFL